MYTYIYIYIYIHTYIYIYRERPVFQRPRPETAGPCGSKAARLT